MTRRPRTRSAQASIARARGVQLGQRDRLTIAATFGVAAGTVVTLASSWQLALLVGWDAAAAFIVGSVWMFIPVLDHVGTQHVALREDDSRALVDVVMVAACLMSLVGVVLGLAHSRQQHGAGRAILTSVAVLTVFLSWFTVHTLFVLRYARLYYSGPPGGIDFPGTDDKAPDYLDFAYMSFTVGMTFQVSDTGVVHRSIRRAVTRHALLSYVFGTVIVGIVINVVGGLIS
ncbi:MAG: DUF1345 domain-containing protein [Ilumatobacteraceae bacterium]